MLDFEEEVLESWVHGAHPKTIIEKVQTKYGVFYKATVQTKIDYVGYARNQNRALGIAYKQYGENLIQVAYFEDQARL